MQDNLVTGEHVFSHGEIALLAGTFIALLLILVGCGHILRLFVRTLIKKLRSKANN